MGIFQLNILVFFRTTCPAKLGLNLSAAVTTYSEKQLRATICDSTIKK